jgi:hypothetical protein
VLWPLLPMIILRKQRAHCIGDFLSAGVAAEVFGVQFRAAVTDSIACISCRAASSRQYAREQHAAPAGAHGVGQALADDVP